MQCIYYIYVSQLCSFCSEHVATISHQPNPTNSDEVGLVLLSMGILIVYMSGASLVDSLGLEHLQNGNECTWDWL